MIFFEIIIFYKILRLNKENYENYTFYVHINYEFSLFFFFANAMWLFILQNKMSST